MTTFPSVGTIVTERDRELLRTLVTTRVLDCEQVMTVGGFTSVRRANRRLLKLVRAGLLRRWFAGTERRGVKALYGLSPEGSRLIGESQQGLLPWKQDRVITSSQFLAHQQSVNTVFIQARFQKLPADASCVRWMNFREPLSAAVPLMPDGYLEIQQQGAVHPMFVEVDLGTEGSKVWRRKVEWYLKFALSADFERKFRQKRFRVLAVFHSSRRLEVVRTTIAQRTDKLFWLSTEDQVRSEGLIAPIWCRPNGTERIPLP
jgi:Replication-relaxation